MPGDKVRYRNHEHKYDTGEVVIDRRGTVFVIQSVEIHTLSKRTKTTIVMYGGRTINYGQPIRGVQEDAIIGYQIPDTQEGMIE